MQPIMRLIIYLILKTKTEIPLRIKKEDRKISYRGSGTHSRVCFDFYFFFEFNNKIKQQICETAVGTKCVPRDASIFMDKV